MMPSEERRKPKFCDLIDSWQKMKRTRIEMVKLPNTCIHCEYLRSCRANWEPGGRQ